MSGPLLIQFILHRRLSLKGQMLRGSASVASSDNRVSVDDLKRELRSQKKTAR